MNQRTVNDQGYRGLAGFAAGQVVFAAVFVFLLLSAFHQPAPHALPVGVVAAPAITRQLQVALDAHEPGGFDLRSISTAMTPADSLGSSPSGPRPASPRSSCSYPASVPSAQPAAVARLTLPGRNFHPQRDTTASSMSALRPSADHPVPARQAR